jgi:hypothetical protein
MFVFRPLPVVNTFIALGVQNGKSDSQESASTAIISDLVVNQKVRGSNPNRGAKFIRYENSPPSG